MSKIIGERPSVFNAIKPDAIAEHSICQPGRPFPHGESQLGSPGFDAFQRAKSLSDFFSLLYVFANDPSPSARAAALPTASGTSFA